MPQSTVDVVAAEVATTSPTRQHSYVDWPAIFAGAVVAWALAFVMGTFGSGIGLTMTGGPWSEGASPGWFLAAATLWFIWVQVTSVMAGGYLAGRLRGRLPDANPHEVEIRDGAHGLVVWAVSALVGAMLAFGAATAGLGAAAQLTGGVASVAAGAVGSSADDNRLSYVVDRVFRAPTDSERAADAADTGASDPAQSMSASQQTMAGTADDTIDGRDRALRVVDAIGLDGELAEDDKAYLAELVAQETGLTPAQARTRIDGYLTQTLTEMRQAADAARKTGIVVSFLVAATLLVSAIAGWWAAGVGGRHRDENINLSRWFAIR